MPNKWKPEPSGIFIRVAKYGPDLEELLAERDARSQLDNESWVADRKAFFRSLTLNISEGTPIDGHNIIRIWEKLLLDCCERRGQGGQGVGQPVGISARSKRSLAITEQRFSLFYGDNTDLARAAWARHKQCEREAEARAVVIRGTAAAGTTTTTTTTVDGSKRRRPTTADIEQRRVALMTKEQQERASAMAKERTKPMAAKTKIAGLAATIRPTATTAAGGDKKFQNSTGQTKTTSRVPRFLRGGGGSKKDPGEGEAGKIRAEQSQLIASLAEY